MTLIEYIREFERLYNNIEVYKMKLPAGVLAYRVLKSANIYEETHPTLHGVKLKEHEK